MKWMEEARKWPLKRIAYGAVVISTIAASSSFGTYAYFTDTKEVGATFASGTLHIDLSEEKAAEATFGSGETAFMPGSRLTKAFVLSNKSSSAVKYALQAEPGEGGENAVYDQLIVDIREAGSDALLYSGKVKNLSRANVVISNFDKDAQMTLDYTVSLPESAGNDVMGLTSTVDFGFLATQSTNSDYFAQSGPVMTLTPEQFSGQGRGETLDLLAKAVEGTTFVLGEGEYHLPANLKLGQNIRLQADKGKEGKVKLYSDGGAGDAILRLDNASVDGLTFMAGAETAIEAGSHVNISRCEFSGDFDTAIRAKEQGEGSAIVDVAISQNAFLNNRVSIDVSADAQGVVIDQNRFEQAEKAIHVKNEKHVELQVTRNDFAKVGGVPVESDGVRIGDGIAGFSETDGKLALHLQHLDIYLADNHYPKGE
ncbi:TasA family protein [Brevibacillus fluminis]|uniref:TasA family protein n=1 Tax=Brevibacillus fluminis TaxID=511487 RepID=UPI003F8C4C16